MASKKNILDSFGWFLEKLKSNFVKKSGDTMTGPLTISKTEIKNNDAEPADKITVSLPKESGTLMLEPESVTKNTVYAGPSSADGNPEFRTLTNSDLPDDFVANNVSVLTLTVSNLQQRVDGVTGEVTNTSTHCDINFPLESPNITVDLPSKSGTFALKSDIPDILTSDNTFNGKNSFVSAWDGTTGKESISDYQLIIDMPTKENDPDYKNHDYYPAIWFRDKNFSGDYINKNTCCLLWNTVDDCFSMYNQATGRVKDLAFEESIDALNAKIGIFYLAESLLTPAASGDTTLAALIKRLFSKGYLYGQASIGNYPELPVQSWTYVLKWQFTFDSNRVLVEIQQLYYTTKYTRWLDTSTGTWVTDSWS